MSEKTNLTRGQMQKKVNRFRFLMNLAGQNGPSPKRRAGRELFLHTEVGKVRVLAYNLDNKETLPLFIDLHGGGFVLGSPEMDDPYMANVAQQANLKIISVDYSLSPEVQFPVAIHECYAVAKYLQTHAEEFGLDPARIAIGGHSAGGTFSAAVCLLNEQRKELDLRCVILDYPPTDVYTDADDKPQPEGSIPPKMSHLFDPCYCEDREERKNPLVSPYYASVDQLRTFPPALVITAGKDSLCREGEAFKDKLIEAGVDVTFRRFEDSKHGFTLSTKNPDAAEGWALMIDFLNRYLHA
jgi:acetyl esterase